MIFFCYVFYWIIFSILRFMLSDYIFLGFWFWSVALFGIIVIFPLLLFEHLDDVLVMFRFHWFKFEFKLCFSLLIHIDWILISPACMISILIMRSIFCRVSFSLIDIIGTWIFNWKLYWSFDYLNESCMWQIIYVNHIYVIDTINSFHF